MYDDDDEYYRHESRAMRDYDRWKTSPPDEPECPACDEKAQRISDLEELVEWVAAHLGRIITLSPVAGVHRYALAPWSGAGVAEGKSALEALEKLWREKSE